MPTNQSALRALVDAIVPADAYPSASQTGVPGFLDRVVREERRSWMARVAGVLETLQRGREPFEQMSPETRRDALDEAADDPDVLWFERLVQMAYYADEGSGRGLAGGSSMLGWSRRPPGGWPTEPAQDGVHRVVEWSQLQPRYDVVVIGSGAGGSVAAAELTESGRSVLVVERGRLATTAGLARDQLRNARTVSGLDPLTMPAPGTDPRTVGPSRAVVDPWDPGWGGNAHVVGGGTRVYGAQAWRFVPTDFRMASVYGRPDGSSLADWPITFADLEPYYGEAEWALGVAGSDEDDGRLAPRSTPYPMPPLPTTRPGDVLAAGARSLGLSLTRVPLAVNSQTFQGRPACAGCSQCVGFTCPIGAKNDAENTFLRRASATGRLSLLPGTRVRRLATDARGRVTGVVLGRLGQTVEVRAGDVVLAAGAVESARLLLLSGTDAEPDGLGNRCDQVGRHLQGHLYGGALGIFDEPVNDDRGPGPVWSTHDHRHHNQGLVGGGMIANEFTPTPVDTYAYLLAAGLVGRHGSEVKATMRRLVPRMQRVVGPVQEMTSAESRVRLDRGVRDALGLPVAHLSGSAHPNDLAVQRLLGERAANWLAASGATQVVVSAPPRSDRPSSGQHQAGTCRMGTDPRSSVTDPQGRVWGHDNLRVVDASLHVTNGGVNPVLTVFANALRILDGWVDGHA